MPTKARMFTMLINNQTQMISQSWNSGSNSWDNNSSPVYTYDAHNNKNVTNLSNMEQR